MGGISDFIFGDSGGDVIQNPGAQDALNQLFPDGAPGLIEAGEVAFDPSLIFQGLGIQQEFIDKAINFATQNFDQAAGFQSPFVNGLQGFNAFSGGILDGSFDPRNNANAFTAGPGNPEFDFRLDQGINAIDASASGRGLLNSGTRAKDLNGFAQGLSSTFSTQDLNNRLALSQANFGNLGALAGIEQNASNNLSNIYTGLGQLGAGAYTGGANAALSALTQGAGLQNQTALANAAAAQAALSGNLGAFTGLSGSNVGVTQPQSGIGGQIAGQAIGAYLGTLI